MTALGLAAALPFNQTKGDPLLALGPVFAIRAKDSVEGEQWALNKGTGGPALSARYGSVGRVEIRRGAGLIIPQGAFSDVVSIPNNANLNFTSPFELVGCVQFRAQAFSAQQQIISKWSGYGLYLQTSGRPSVSLWDGVSEIVISASVIPTLNPLTWVWFKAEVTPNDGSGNRKCVFYYSYGDPSSEPTSWTKIGTDVIIAGAVAISNTTANLAFGSLPAGTQQIPVFGRGIVRSSIGGTKVVDVDFTQQNDFTSSFTCTTGQTVTVTAANAVDTNDPLLLKKAAENYVLLPGTNLNNVSIPDAANLQPTTSMSYRSLVALEDWTPSTSNLLASQWTTGNDKCWTFSVTTSGNLEWRGSIDLTAQAIITSTLPISSVVSDNEKIAVRVDWTASPAEIKFYYKTVNGSAIDAITSDSDWTQLGTTVTASVPSTSLANSTEAFRFGAHGGASFMAGKLFAGVLYVNGSLIISADFTTNTNQNSFVCTTGQTVTFNRATSGRKLVVVTQPVWSLGTDDYLEVADNDLLDFGASDSLTALVVLRRWVTLAGNARYVSKRATVGYTITASGGSTAIETNINDGTWKGPVTQTLDLGVLGVAALVRDIAGGNIHGYLNGSLRSSPDASPGSLASSTVLRVGAEGGGSLYADGEIFAVYIYRKALSAAEIAAGVQYWQVAA